MLVLPQVVKSRVVKGQPVAENPQAVTGRKGQAGKACTDIAVQSVHNSQTMRLAERLPWVVSQACQPVHGNCR